MQEVYTDEEWLGDLTIFLWHKAFSEGWETTALLLHVGWPSSIYTEEKANTVTAILSEDRHITVRQLAHALDISKSPVHTILSEELKIRWVTACCVPHFLTQEQWDHHIETCREWLKRIEDELNVMEHVTAGNERCIHHFDLTIKQESTHWKSPQSPVKKKVHQEKSMNKIKLVLFFDAWGVQCCQIVFSKIHFSKKWKSVSICT